MGDLVEKTKAEMNRRKVSRMMPVVVDTNVVAKVANGREESPQASPRLRGTPVSIRLEGIMRDEKTLVLDNRLA